MNSNQRQSLSRRMLGAASFAMIAGIGLGSPAFADQSASDTPIGSVVEDAPPPRDVSSYTLVEILNAHDPALLRAALDKNPSIVRAHFENGMTALQIASQLGDDEAVGILISYGANVDATDYYGRTAIYYALTANVDCYPVVNLLCLHHANLFWYDVNGDFLFDIAARLGNPRVLGCFTTYHAPRRVDYPDARARELAHKPFIAESRVRVAPKVVVRGGPAVVHEAPARVEQRREVVVAPEKRVVVAPERHEAEPAVDNRARGDAPRGGDNRENERHP